MRSFPVSANVSILIKQYRYQATRYSLIKSEGAQNCEGSLRSIHRARESFFKRQVSFSNEKSVKEFSGF